MELSRAELIFLTGILGILIYFIVKRILFLKSLPPGPWGLPVLGSMFHLNRNGNVLVEFEKYKEQYGPIFSVGVGNFNVIVLNGYKLIQEALKQDVLNGRADFEAWTESNGGFRNRGILFCDGNGTWSEQRRFALRNLRDFGFGKQSMEGLLLQELEELITHIKKDVGKPVSLRFIFNGSVLNSLWFILTGNRFELEDDEFRNLITMISTSLQQTKLAGSVFFFPQALKLFGRKIWNYATKMRAQNMALMKKIVEEHEATFQEGSSRDFIDAYLQERSRSQPGSSFSSEEGRMNLRAVLKDLFIAGVETTSTTLLWTVLFLTKHPEVQAKVHAEIDLHIGRSRLPTRDDKAKLVYVEAVLNEVHRKASLLPMSVYHKVLEDTHFGGHFFPKDTVLFPNLYEAHHNVAYWKDPQNFRPERFLDSSGTRLVKHEPLMPFSTGKRACLGEALARDTLFLFFVGIFQLFTFELAPESRNISFNDYNPTFILSPKDFKVIVQNRD